MIRFALLLTLTACGTRQAPQSTPDAPPVPGDAATPATLPSGTRAPATTTVAAPEAPTGVLAITGLLNAHDTADLPERATLDAHDDAVGSLVWIAKHGDPLVIRARAMHALGQYDDEPAVQTHREAVANMEAHPIIVASAIRGLTVRGLTEGDESYELILKRDSETDVRIVAAILEAKDSATVE